MKKMWIQTPVRKAQIEDLRGTKWGKLTVIEYAGRCSCKKSTWLCQCDCGVYTTVIGASMKSGRTKSCGCLQVVGIETHGQAYHPDYPVWRGMIDRCTDQKNDRWYRYGGRGISVCDRWINDPETFFKDMGKRPKSMSIERKDNDGDYEPGNCKWATNIEQANNKSINVYVEYKGEVKTIAQWARKYKMPYMLVWSRVEKGWGIKRALTEPRYEVPVISFNGITDTYAGWAKRIGMRKHTLWYRINKRGWSIEKSLTTKLMNQG